MADNKDELVFEGMPGADAKTEEDVQPFQVDMNFEDEPKEETVEETQEEEETTETEPVAEETTEEVAEEQVEETTTYRVIRDGNPQENSRNIGIFFNRFTLIFWVFLVFINKIKVCFL